METRSRLQSKIIIVIFGLIVLFHNADLQGININCPSSISVLEALNCTIKTVGASAVRQVIVAFGDGNSETFNLSALMPYPYYFNYSIPTNNITAGLTGATKGVTYYLLNTEFKYDGALQSVQFFVLSPGLVQVYVVMMINCPDTYYSYTCASSLYSVLTSGTPYCSNMTMNTMIASKNLTAKGYNSISIANYQIPKGAFLAVYTDAVLAIEPKASTYPDAYLSYPYSCVMTSIGARLMVNFVYQPTLTFPFSHQYSIPSVYTLMAQISLSSAVQSLDASINPTSQLFVTDCNFPAIYIYNRAKYGTSPKVVTRSMLFSIATLTIYNCNITFSEGKTWEANLVNETTTDAIRAIDLTGNPTSRQAEIVIQPLTMGYGLYQFIYNVVLITKNESGVQVTPPAQLSTYVRVVPTGISVYAFPQRLRLLNRGLDDEIPFLPTVYSFDLDNYTDTSRLTYTYTCEIVSNGVGLGVIQALTPGVSPTVVQNSCFNSSSGYKFDASGNTLTVLPGGLAYNPSYLYRFTVSTVNLGRTYSQTFYIGLSAFSTLPTLTVGCKFPSMCQAFQTYQRINPNTQLIVNGVCLTGCDIKSTSMSTNIYFSVSMNAGTPTSPNWVLYKDTMGLLIGQNTTQLTMFSSLFSNYSSYLYWKVEYIAEIRTNGFLTAVGLAGIMIKINEPPIGGDCYMSSYNGTALSTVFTITCINWVDPDGSVPIPNYEFYARYPSSSTRMMLASNAGGQLTMQLPPGLDSDGNYLEISVDIIDDGNGVTQYFFLDYVQVLPDLTQASSIVSQLNSFDPNSTFIQQLRGGNIQVCAQNVIGLATMIKNIPMPSTLSGTSNATAEFNNQKAIARELLMQSVKNISISSISGAKVISTLIQSVTESVDEITRDTASMATDVLGTIADTLNTVNGDSSIEDLKQAAHGAILGLGNLIYGLNGPLNSRATYLISDMTSSSANSSNSSSASAGLSYVDMQRNQSVYSAQQAKNVLDTIVSITASHMSVNQSHQIVSDTIKFNLINLPASSISNTLSLSFGQVETPSFCQMASSLSLNSTNCSDALVTQKTVELANPYSGRNGDSSGSSVGLSNQISLGYFDENQNEIPITGLATPIKIKINRNLTGQPLPTFKVMNVTTMNQTNRTEYATFGMTLTGQSLSIHINILPYNRSVCYVMLFKFGETPVYNSTYRSYDYWKMYCPSDLLTLNSDQFYRFFLNMTQVNSYTGFVGYAIREMTDAEMALYTGSAAVNNTLTSPPVLDKMFEFRYEIAIMLFTSGCYYYDHETSNWISDGVDVLETTNQYVTECVTTHLTDFAGGFIVLPPAIDFNHVFANASFTQNLAIYITVILVCSLFILLAIWARCMDRRDVQRMGVTPLADNQPGDKYFYEIIVFTGSRKDAATDSKVHFILSGDAGETKIRNLDDNKRRIFRRAGIDSFVMTNKKSLGDLTYLRIWHDNTGRGADASWFLKSVIIHDLQTRQSYYFICEQWLAVEKGDGAIERFLPVCGDKQKTEFKYLMAKQTKNKLSDGHMWFSVFVRPTASTFSRLDRLTCCFVILCISMLANILYYGVDKSPAADGLKIGPFNLTPQQIGIGLMTNLIVFPPSFLLVQIFRRSRRRVSRAAQLKATVKKIKDDNLKHAHMTGSFSNFDSDSRAELFRAPSAQSSYETPRDHEAYAVSPPMQAAPSAGQPAKKKKRPFTLPWWWKIIAYIMSFVFAAVSLFFIIMQGISLGNDQVTKWVTSLAVSFVTSVLLTQPLEVIILSFLFITIFRSQTEDLETESDDDLKPLNHDETWLHSGPKGAYDSNDYNKENFLRKQCNPYDEDELKEIRLRRMNEVKIMKILREIFFYSMFLWILYVVSYLNNDSNLALYQQRIKSYFLDSPMPVSFYQITKPKDIWAWLDLGLLPLLNANSYNGNPASLSQYIFDSSSIMIGYPLVRQLRVENNSCSLNGLFQNSIGFCNPDYGFLDQEKRYFSYNWNQTTSVSVNDQNVLNAFKYTDSDDIDSYPSMGIYTSYFGGGYVYKMQGSQSQISANLSYLQQLNWIDRQTRGIFVEFTVYNPSINIFCFTTLLIELMPTGNIDLTARFDPLKLFQTSGSGTAFSLACNLLYMAFVVYFMVREGKALYKQRLRYFLNFWVYVELLIIAFSWAAFSMYLYRMYAADKLLDLFKTNYQATKPTTEVINMQYMSYMNGALTFCLAFCCALGTIKFLKLLRFNRRVSQLGDTLRYCLKDLISFSFIFMIVWLAFIQLMYLTFNEKTIGYSTFVKSMETCFQIIMGKFSVQPMIEANELLGPLYFSCYNIMVVFILIGMFITIISNGFTAVRLATANTPEDPERDANVVDYLVDLFKSAIPFRSGNKVVHDTVPSQRYRDTVTYFPDAVVNLTNLLDKMITTFQENKYQAFDMSRNQRNFQQESKI